MHISFSAKEKYDTCPRLYKLHYIDKIRPTSKPSPLIFGNALDSALNDLVQSKDMAKSIEIFNTEWTTYKDLPNIEYLDSDYNDTVFLQFDKPDSNKYNATWLSMLRKGQRLIEAYTNNILPKIKKVITVQKQIVLNGSTEDNQESDDVITGLADLEAVIEVDGKDVVAILDNKTTGSPYPKNSFKTKHQTALYTYATGVKFAGFLTVNKKTFDTQIIVGEVPEELQDKVIDEFIKVIDNIKNEKFDGLPKNKCWAFGKRCSYYNYCWSGSMEGLYVKSKDEENK